MFTLKNESTHGRLGTMTLAHGTVTTPLFFPVGTAGAMKGISFTDLETLGAEVLLANTYHLHLHPGEKTIEKCGGLHSYIGWDKPMLTDSGGYQVFSLRKISTITDEGVTFQSPRDGSKRHIGPKEAMHIQHALGADIIMCFDECPPSTGPRIDQMKAVDRTLMWAQICKKEHDKLNKKKKPNRKSRLFGIVQGGLEHDLRKKCAEELVAMDFDGYAIGGLAVGEGEKHMIEIVSLIAPMLPKGKPRYLMGVGDLSQMERTIALGIDMFDCVAAMREGRHGNIWLSDGSKLRITNAKYLKDFSPIDAKSPSPLSSRHNRSYLCHLMRLGERYGETIACMQNVGVTLEHIRNIRKKIGE